MNARSSRPRGSPPVTRAPSRHGSRQGAQEGRTFRSIPGHVKYSALVTMGVRCSPTRGPLEPDACLERQRWGGEAGGPSASSRAPHGSMAVHRVRHDKRPRRVPPIAGFASNDHDGGGRRARTVVHDPAATPAMRRPGLGADNDASRWRASNSRREAETVPRTTPPAPTTTDDSVGATDHPHSCEQRSTHCRARWHPGSRQPQRQPGRAG